MRSVAAAFSAILVAFALAGAGAAATAPLTLPAGTALHVRLTTTLTSKTNKTGDPFTGEITQPVTSAGKTLVPRGTLVKGHVAFVKPSGRIRGRAQMRIVLDQLTTPDNLTYQLSGTLQGAKGGTCDKTASDQEGTVKGCGKSKKNAAKDAAIMGAVGAGTGATVGMGQEIDCRYFGNCGGPGFGTDVMYGAGIGAGTALIYNLFKHEKQVVLVDGTELTFVVNRSVEANKVSAAPAGP